MPLYYVQSGKLRKGPLSKERIVQAIRESKLPPGSEIIDADSNEIVLPDELLNPGVAFVNRKSDDNLAETTNDAIDKLRSEVSWLRRMVTEQRQVQEPSGFWTKRRGSGFISTGAVVGLFVLYHFLVVGPIKAKVDSLVKWADQPFLVGR